MAFSLEAANRNPNVDATMARLGGLEGGSGKNMWGLGDDKLWIIGMALSNIDETPGSGGSCVSKPYPREAPDFPGMAESTLRSLRSVHSFKPRL